MQVYEGHEPYIFVSYSHKDASQVLPCLEALCANGYRVWYDSGIEAGTEWPAYIEDHLNRCARVVVFMSESAVESVNCRNEINLALKKGKDVLVVYLESTELRFGMDLQLGSSQSLFAYRHPNEESFLRELCAARMLEICKGQEVTTEISIPVTLASSRMSDEAKDYYERAKFGDADAQFNFGVCCDDGDGVKKDISQAVYWYRKAAEQGHAGAQCNLGVCYESGEGVEKDLSQAVFWYRKAAEQRNMYARFNLGFCYQYGQGVEKDTSQAVYWYRKAARQGNKSAQKALERLGYGS